MRPKDVTFQGWVMNLAYEDAGAMLEWLARAFGFEERARYVDKDGVVRQAEMMVGDSELWFSGHGPGFWEDKGHGPDHWVLIWIDDVDTHHDRAKAEGAEISRPPEDQDYGVRNYCAVDPEGYNWVFMRRLGTGYVQRVPTEEGGLEEIVRAGGR